MGIKQEKFFKRVEELTDGYFDEIKPLSSRANDFYYQNMQRMAGEINNQKISPNEKMSKWRSEMWPMYFLSRGVATLDVYNAFTKEPIYSGGSVYFSKRAINSMEKMGDSELVDKLCSIVPLNTS